MVSYCDINNAYMNKKITNDNYLINDLEKEARKINNEKKLKSKDIYRNFRDSKNNDSLLKNNTETNLNGFFSAQGTYADFNDNKLSLIKEIEEDKSENSSKTDGIYLDTPTETDSKSSDSSFSSITIDTKDIDTEIKTKSKFNIKKKSKRHKCMDFDIDVVDSLESLDSGESLLQHIRYCKDCKSKVMKLIKEHNSKKKKYSKKIEVPKEKKELDTNTSFIKTPEIKEIAIVCLISFLVIIVLDLIMKK